MSKTTCDVRYLKATLCTDRFKCETYLTLLPPLGEGRAMSLCILHCIYMTTCSNVYMARWCSCVASWITRMRQSANFIINLTRFFQTEECRRCISGVIINVRGNSRHCVEEMKRIMFRYGSLSAWSNNTQYLKAQDFLKPVRLNSASLPCNNNAVAILTTNTCLNFVYWQWAIRCRRKKTCVICVRTEQRKFHKIEKNLFDPHHKIRNRFIFLDTWIVRLPYRLRDEHCTQWSRFPTHLSRFHMC